MSIKLLTRVKCGVIGLLMSMVALPLWAAPMKIESSVDNSRCLLNPADDCIIDLKLTEYYERIYLKNQTGFQVTDGKVFVYFNPSSDYTTQLSRQEYIPSTQTVWAPFINGSGYLFRVGSKNGATPGEDEVPIVGELELYNKETKKTEYKICGGSLELSNSFYRNHLSPQKGLVCEIQKGLYPVALTLKSGVGENLPIHIMMRDPNTRTRALQIPKPWVMITAQGFNGVGTWVDQITTQKRVLFNQPYILLNDRLCKINTQNTSINFGQISTTEPVGKIAEQKMPLTVTCTGVRQPNPCGTATSPDCRPSTASWVGVDNNLVGIKIFAQTPLTGVGAEKKIGLQTNDKVRDDLFVEGSWQYGQECGVASLFTNGTQNNIDRTYVPAIRDPKQQAPSVSLPSLYWRLCAQPKNGGLLPGRFEGQATISVEYD